MKLKFLIVCTICINVIWDIPLSDAIEPLCGLRQVSAIRSFSPTTPWEYSRRVRIAHPETGSDYHMTIKFDTRNPENNLITVHDTEIISKSDSVRGPSSFLVLREQFGKAVEDYWSQLTPNRWPEISSLRPKKIIRQTVTNTITEAAVKEHFGVLLDYITFTSEGDLSISPAESTLFRSREDRSQAENFLWGKERYREIKSAFQKDVRPFVNIAEANNFLLKYLLGSRGTTAYSTRQFITLLNNEFDGFALFVSGMSIENGNMAIILDNRTN